MCIIVHRKVDHFAVNLQSVISLSSVAKRSERVNVAIHNISQQPHHNQTKPVKRHQRTRKRKQLLHLHLFLKPPVCLIRVLHQHFPEKRTASKNSRKIRTISHHFLKAVTYINTPLRSNKSLANLHQVHFLDLLVLQTITEHLLHSNHSIKKFANVLNISHHFLKAVNYINKSLSTTTS